MISLARAKLNLLEEVEPIFVVSPTARCGTTLVQRLLNSSREMIIFGEEALIYKELPEILSHLLDRLRFQEKEIAETRRKFKEETTEFWSNALLPSSEEFLEAGRRWLLETVQVCEKSAKDFNCDRWGFKFPLQHHESVSIYKKFLPKARFIYIYRNLIDIAKSFKARKWFNGSKDIAKLAYRWKQNQIAAFKEKDRNFLFLRYEDLVSQPRKIIPILENFARIEGIRLEVMDKKINTWPGKGEGHSPNSYVSPEELKEDEIQLLEKVSNRFFQEAESLSDFRA